MNDNFSSVGSILKTECFDNQSSNFSLLVNNWKDIIGEIYAQKTQAASISYKNGKTIIYINALSGSIIQDLNFYKKNILYKIKSKFNIEADEIIFKLNDKKSDYNYKVKPSITQTTYYKNPTDEELKDIELDEDDIAAINKIKNQKFLTDEKKQQIIDFMLKDFKAQKWMKLNGYPVCKKCGKILRYKNFNEDTYCEACKYLLKNNIEQ